MNEEGVTRLMEYIIITGVLLVLMIVMIFVVNAVLMEGPADRLRYHAFVDIGNGVSTRVVDLYVIAPGNGTIATKFRERRDGGRKPGDRGPGREHQEQGCNRRGRGDEGCRRQHHRRGVEHDPVRLQRILGEEENHEGE